MTSESFLLRQRICISDEVTLLSNGISMNFAKIMLYLRDMANFVEIFERS